MNTRKALTVMIGMVVFAAWCAMFAYFLSIS